VLENAALSPCLKVGACGGILTSVKEFRRAEEPPKIIIRRGRFCQPLPDPACPSDSGLSGVPVVDVDLDGSGVVISYQMNTRASQLTWDLLQGPVPRGGRYGEQVPRGSRRRGPSSSPAWARAAVRRGARRRAAVQSPQGLLLFPPEHGRDGRDVDRVFAPFGNPRRFRVSPADGAGDAARWGRPGRVALRFPAEVPTDDG